LVHFAEVILIIKVVSLCSDES